MAFIKIDRKKYIHNLNLISKRLKKKKLLMVVLKDNAYGHGIEIVAKMAKEEGIEEAVVKDFEEAKEISSFFNNILILNPSLEFKKYQKNFSLAINSIEYLERVPKNIKIELKIDTGMHRNGILPEKLNKALSIIREKNLNFFGFFTHFRSADELSGELFWQIKEWEESKKRVIKFCKKSRLKIPRFHSKNSSALFRSSKKVDEYVRIGIATYGYLERDKIFGRVDLKPILSLYAKKISTRVLKEKQKVGYGGFYQAKKDIKISTYDLGYSDGFFRVDPTKKIKIKDGYILGKVSMDYITSNSQKEEICIFDDTKELQKHFKTISYEILVKLPKNLKRVIV